MNQRELKERIMSDPDLTVAEKNRMLRDIRAPYYQMSDEELLQLIRDFVAENGRVPERKDLIYDVDQAALRSMGQGDGTSRS